MKTKLTSLGLSEELHELGVKGYWYKFQVHFCPVCGQEYQHKKERMFTEKPKEYCKRHIYKEVYDYCNSL